MADDDPSETTLAERLAVAPLRPEVVARLGLLACRALAPGARRDLGPAAILLAISAEGDVTVRVRPPEGAGAPRSPTYLAPEVATHASPPDARSDVYSLSMILYEALAGALPLPRCATVEELLTVLVTHDRRPLDDVAPWLDPSLVRVIERGLQREPSRRWASPADLGEALQPFTAGSERITASELRGLPAGDRLPPAPRRDSRAIVGTLAAVLVLACSAALIAVRAYRLAADVGARIEPPAPVPGAVEPDEERAPPPLYSKKEVATAVLEGGSLFIHLDPRRPGVVVPARFLTQSQLVLQVGWHMAVPIPDLQIDRLGISGTLSFDHKPFTCKIPWTAVYALVGEDGRGGVWNEDVPPEVAAEERAKKQREADAGPP